MKLKLYHCPFACSGVTMNALEEAGLDYDDQLINIAKGEQKRPEYLAIHPDGKVPALAVDDRVLTENPSILTFLHGIAPGAKLLPDVGSPQPGSARGSPLARKNAVERARQVSDLVWCSATLHPMVRQIRMPVRYTDGDPSGVQAKGHEYLHGVCARVDTRLEDNDWWYGADWSIVDVYLRWLVTTAASAGFAVQDYANVVGLVRRVEERASFQRAKAREDAARASM